ALALMVFVLGEAIRSKAERYRWLAAILRRPLAFEAYYRTNPPRRFLYYVLYPLLFPYWLINRDARAEFLLFKGYTAPTLAILVISSTYQFFFFWQPELGFAKFLPTVVATFAIESLIVLAFLMPVAT